MKQYKYYLAQLLVFLMVMGISTPIYAEVLTEQIAEQKTLVKGVEYTNIKRLYDTGWQDIYVVKADLSEKHLAFDVLSNANGVSYLEDTLTSVKEAGAVAGINADFFAAKKGQSGRGSSVGVNIKDGELVSTPASDEDMSAFYQLENGEMYFNKFTYDITVTAPNGQTHKIRHINKYDDLREICLYNSNWNGLSLGADGDVIEVVVENNTVKEKRRNAEPVEIPENGFVLTENLSIDTFLDDNSSVGDEIKIDMITAPDFKGIESAVGGGAMVLVDGVVPSRFSHTIYGNQPRSAIGLDKTGKVVYFVAVDGRRNGASGMTQAQLGSLMLSLGCYNALNFDGGGSTLLAINDDGEYRTANTPSDGGKRKVTNSAGIVSTAEVGKIASIKIFTDDIYAFKNLRRQIYAEAYDEYAHKIYIEQTDVKYSVSGVTGGISDGFLIAGESGTAVITADYEGITSKLEIEVLDNISCLDFQTQKITIDSGKSTVLWIYAKNADGKRAFVYPSDLEMNSQDAEAAYIEGNKVVAKAFGGTVLTAKYGDVTAYASVSVDSGSPPHIPDNIIAADSKNVYAELKGESSFRFSVFGNTRTPKIMFDLYLMNNMLGSIKKNAEKYAFVGTNIDTNFFSPIEGQYISTDGYAKTTYKGSVFLTINNINGDIFSSDSKQWSKFKNEFSNINGENVFIFMNKYSISSNLYELQGFRQLLEACADKGSNVYVFGYGYKNKVEILNGVRYVTTGGVFESVGYKKGTTNVSYVKYFLVTVNGNEVTYEIKPIVEGHDD